MTIRVAGDVFIRTLPFAGILFIRDITPRYEKTR